MRKEILAAAFVLSGCAVNPNETAVFPETKIIVASDLHYLGSELTDHGEFFEDLIRSADGKAMNSCREITDSFIHAVIEEKPEVLVVTGDLSFNGEKESMEELAESLRNVKNAGIEVYVIPGNHDIDNASAVRYSGDGYEHTDNVSAQQFRSLFADYGYEGAFSYDTSSGSYTIRTDSGLCFLMIDVNMTETYNTVPESTLKWMEKQLKEAQKDGYSVLSFSHQNLLKHSILEKGFVIENADQVLQLLNRYQVTLHMSGHMHIQHAQNDGITEIASSSLLVAPFQYGVLNLTEDSVEYHTEQTDLSACPEADDFFESTCYEKTLSSLGGEHAEEMAGYFTELNKAYFRGDLRDIEIDGTCSGYWEELGGFSAKYIHSMEEEKGQQYISLTIERRSSDKSAAVTAMN